jgi:hypothetical protein
MERNYDEILTDMLIQLDKNTSLLDAIGLYRLYKQQYST